MYSWTAFSHRDQWEGGQHKASFFVPDFHWLVRWLEGIRFTKRLVHLHCFSSSNRFRLCSERRPMELRLTHLIGIDY